jgi:hypothetical protein
VALCRRRWANESCQRLLRPLAARTGVSPVLGTYVRVARVAVGRLQDRWGSRALVVLVCLEWVRGPR